MVNSNRIGWTVIITKIVYGVANIPVAFGLTKMTYPRTVYKNGDQSKEKS